MYNCPNCGAGMRYDIPGKMLMCDHCGSTCGVNAHPDQLLMAAQDDYEATVFTCPQCGGRILSTDNAVSDFCTYCGASVTLEGRLSNEKKPDLILPFSRTKEECRDSYRDYVKGIWCLPEEYKSERFLEKCEGIYLPFWIFRFSQKGEGSLDGTRVAGSYKEYCTVSYELDNHHDWICYDAASLFDDEISSGINSFSEHDAVEFNPAYLSGFYADIPDVEYSVYTYDAEEEVNYRTFVEMMNCFSLRDMKVDIPQNLSGPFHTALKDVKSALCPVWFVTWRNQKRVAYAAVNGCNGDCVSNLPVSYPKYLLLSLLLAFPFTLLFLSLPVLMAKTMLSAVLAFSMVMMWIYYRTACESAGRELHLTDKGYMSRRPVERLKASAVPIKEKKRNFGKSTKTATVVLLIVWGCIFLTFGGYRLGINPEEQMGIVRFLVRTAAIPAAAVLCVKGIHLSRAAGSFRILADILILGGTTIAAAVISFTNPVHDYFYYFGAVLVLLGILSAALGMIHQYNRICTHPIPEYYDREEAGKDA